MMLRKGIIIALFISLFLFVSHRAVAALTFDIVSVPHPSASSYSTSIALLPDGRLAAFDGEGVFVQDTMGSEIFTPIGSMPSGVGADTAFLLLSPDASRYLLGTGLLGEGRLFTMSSTGGSAAEVADIDYHFSGVWRNAVELFINNSEADWSSSEIRLFNVDTGDPSIIVVDDIPGASAGVALDPLGNLYAATGYPTSPTQIRQFSASEVANAIATGTPLDFCSDGSSFYSTDLSAYNMTIDSSGYLWVSGYGSTERIQIDEPSDVQIYDPAGGSTMFYSFLTTKGNSVAAYYRDYSTDEDFAAVTVIPEPSLLLLGVGSMLLCITRNWSRRNA